MVFVGTLSSESSPYLPGLSVVTLTANTGSNYTLQFESPTIEQAIMPYVNTGMQVSVTGAWLGETILVSAVEEGGPV